MEPLAEKNLNVATVRPMSKIPTFGSSASGLRPPTGVPCSFKRAIDKEEVSMMYVLCVLSRMEWILSSYSNLFLFRWNLFATLWYKSAGIVQLLSVKYGL